MRQLMLTAAMLCLGTLTGCGSCGGCGNCGGGCGNGGGARLSHSHGVCDCEQDDYCSSRSPWIRTNTMLAPPVVSEPIAPPAKLPDGKKDL